MENESSEQLIAVPKRWFESLLEYAMQFDEIEKKWEYGKNEINDKIHLRAVVLAGYAQSSQYIIKSSQRVEKPKK